MRNSQTLNLLRSHVCRTRHYLCTKRTWAMAEAGCEPSGQHTTTTTERSIKAARIFYGQRCACMCKIPDILSGQWTQVSSTLADACSCEGRPHASDNTYSAVRLFPQANITDNTQTTRIQRCSSRTCTPIYPSMSAPICFRRAILR